MISLGLFVCLSTCGDKEHQRSFEKTTFVLPRPLSHILIFENDEPDPSVVKVQIQIYGINAVPICSKAITVYIIKESFKSLNYCPFLVMSGMAARTQQRHRPRPCSSNCSLKSGAKADQFSTCCCAHTLITPLDMLATKMHNYLISPKKHSPFFFIFICDYLVFPRQNNRDLSIESTG